MAAERDLSPEYVRLRAEAERFADQFDRSSLAPAPLSGIAILTCMDARIVVEEIFGLRAGDANVMRNAGAYASDDFIRSLVLSQRVLGSSEVIVLGHTGCGLHALDEDVLLDQLEAETGSRGKLLLGAFADLEDHVRRQVARIAAHPWVRSVPIHGLIYEVDSGRLREISRRREPGPT